MHSYDVIQISETQIIKYRETVGTIPRSQKQIENEKNLRDITYQGYMSKKTKSKVAKMLATWINSVRYGNSDFNHTEFENKPYISFLTLTLSEKQKHTDLEIKRLLLNRFLVTLSQKSLIRNYFWRAEAQKNGNIHFHILLDSYVKKEDVRDIWCSCLRENGYISTDFSVKNAGLPPASMIHKIEKLNNVEAYICKYCCKTDGYRGISGRVWGCSDNIRNLKACTLYLEDYVARKLERLTENKEIEALEGDNFTIYKVNGVQFLRKNFRAQHKMYVNYLIGVYLQLYYNCVEQSLEEEFQIADTQDILNKVDKVKCVQLGLF